MRYIEFKSEDFAKDAFFVRWIKTRDEESNWFWNSFMKQHPEKRVEIEEAIKIVNLVKFRSEALAPEEREAMIEKLKLSIHAEKRQEPTVNFKQSKGWVTYAKVAAMVAFPLLVLSVFFLPDKEKVVSQLTESFSAETVETRVNPKGQKSVIYLEDGTKVWLNSESKLTYNVSYHDASIREVYLEGEAFFDVASDPSKPFVVHTSDIFIRVLGTAFNVKSYSNDNTIETTLLHGKVTIESKGNKRPDRAYTLSPNERAVFEKNEQQITIAKVNAKSSTSWTKEQLDFDEEPIDEVLVELERWFNIEIDAPERGSLHCKLTASIKDETLEEVLEFLKVTHQIEYTIENGKVTIEGKFCEN